MLFLLYNLVIEPMIEFILQSLLKGFRINDSLTRVLIKVYADDTTVFLGLEDDPTDL